MSEKTQGQTRHKDHRREFPDRYHYLKSPSNCCDTQHALLSSMAVCHLSIISFISIFNAINILVSPLKSGFILLLKVWHHDEPCKMETVSKINESIFDLVQASASA